MAAVPLGDVLKVMQWNSRSLRNKIVEFKANVEQYNYDIIAIQESWLKPRNNTPYINTYDTIRKDRNNNDRKAGGLLLFIKNTIHYIEKNVQEYPNGNLEIQIVTIKTNEGSIDIMNYYNPYTVFV